MRGVWTALITPFQTNLKIDFPALEKILVQQVEAKIAGVVVCGTTGESTTLSIQEKKELILFTQSTLKNTPLKVIAGTGNQDTEESLALSKWAAQQTIDGLLLVTPFYNKPSQTGLELHFKKIATAVPHTEIILYHSPGRSGVSLTPETILKLAQLPNITTIKEASGQITQMSEIMDHLKNHQQHLDLLSGDDITFLPSLAIGTVGVISVLSNLLPKEILKIQLAMDNNDYQTAMTLHQTLYPLMRDLFIESNPVPIKYALSLMQSCRPDVRLPLTLLQEQHQLQLQKTLKKTHVLS